MAASLYFTTGQVANQLSASQAQIRALCESGAIKSESTPGHQFRIPGEEVERLKRTGLPEMPRPLPQDGAPAAKNYRLRNGLPVLMAKPSMEVTSAVDQVAVTESLLSRRRLELELADVEDQFEARAAAKAERQVELERVDRARRDEHERVKWLRESEEIAMGRVHADVPAHLRLIAMEAVRQRLELLTPIPTPQVTAEVIDAVLEVELGAFFRLADIETVMSQMRNALPYDVQGSDETVKSALTAAGDVLLEAVSANVRVGMDRLRSVAKRAVDGVIAAFCHEERCQRQLNDRWWLNVSRFPAAQQPAAVAAIATALRALPPGASSRDMSAARDEALQPFHAAVQRARVEEEARVEAERRRAEERRYRNSLISPLSLYLLRLRVRHVRSSYRRDPNGA